MPTLVEARYSKAMPRTTNFRHVKRKRLAGDAVDEAPAIAMEQVVPAQILRSEELDVNTLLTELPHQLSHAQLARLLWSKDYWPIFLHTLGQFADVSTPMAAIVAQLHVCSRSPPEPVGLALLSVLADMPAGV